MTQEFSPNASIDHKVDLGVSEPRPCYPRRRHRLWPKVLLVFCLGLLALVIITVIGGARFVSGVEQTQAAIEDVQDAALDFDFSSAAQGVDSARAGLLEARSGLALVSWAKVIPWVGDQVQAVSVVVDAGLDSVDAVESALVIAEDVYMVVAEAQELLAETEFSTDDNYTFNDFEAEFKADLLRTLANSQADLEEAQVKLELAQADLDRLQDLNTLPQITEAVEPFEEILPELITGINFLVPFAATASEVAGVDQDRQWLVLFLNNQEMRPGGGFIGVFGLMLTRDGEIKNLDVADSYSVDVLVQNDDTYQVAPPDPLRDYVGVSKWYFRDANWSPSFAQSSQDTIQLLRQEMAHAGQPPPEVHGVIGFTPTFASALLDLVGPITVEGDTYTSENLAELLEYEVEIAYVDEGVAKEERKEVVGLLTEEVIDRLMALPIDEWLHVFEVLGQAFSEKQLVFYSQDLPTQQAFVDAGWAADLDVDATDDVLMVVDANLAALKTDPVVDREISYHIEKVDGRYIATTSIKYINTGNFSVFTTRYRTYTRVYAPAGSQLISASGTMLNDKMSNPSLLEGEVDVADELGMTSFGAFVSIEPGEEGTLEFVYELPESVTEVISGRLYQLTVFKQLGAENHTLTLDLDFDKKVRAASPAEAESGFGDSSYEVNTILDQDSVFTVQF